MTADTQTSSSHPRIATATYRPAMGMADDVRSASVKRVVAAESEGSTAVTFANGYPGGN